MSDRELLEAAARAAGIELRFLNGETPFCDGPRRVGVWNPLTDDGDALRLAVKLNLWVNVYSSSQSTPQFTNVIHHEPFIDVYEEHGFDALSATRLAIVKCAAAIGSKLEKSEP